MASLRGSPMWALLALLISSASAQVPPRTLEPARRRAALSTLLGAPAPESGSSHPACCLCPQAFDALAAMNVSSFVTKEAKFETHLRPSSGKKERLGLSTRPRRCGTLKVRPRECHRSPQQPAYVICIWASGLRRSPPTVAA